MLESSLSFEYKYATVCGSEKAVEHVSMLCCSTISETDKWKQLIFRKRTKLHFMGISMDCIPVQDYANKDAWMISEIFKKWQMSWNTELQRKSEKMSLVVGICAAHLHLLI
jgi:hypothetical protein